MPHRTQRLCCAAGAWPTCFGRDQPDAHELRNPPRNPFYTTAPSTMASAFSLMLLAGAYPCYFAATSNSYDPIAGWTPVSDVVEHSKLDLDTLAMETNADLQTDEGFSAAYEAYSRGGNRCVRDVINLTVACIPRPAEHALQLDIAALWNNLSSHVHQRYGCTEEGFIRICF